MHSSSTSQYPAISLAILRTRCPERVLTPLQTRLTDYLVAAVKDGRLTHVSLLLEHLVEVSGLPSNGVPITDEVITKLLDSHLEPPKPLAVASKDFHFKDHQRLERARAFLKSKQLGSIQLTIADAQDENLIRQCLERNFSKQRSQYLIFENSKKTDAIDALKPLEYSTTTGRGELINALHVPGTLSYEQICAIMDKIFRIQKPKPASFPRPDDDGDHTGAI